MTHERYASSTGCMYAFIIAPSCPSPRWYLSWTPDCPTFPWWSYMKRPRSMRSDSTTRSTARPSPVSSISKSTMRRGPSLRPETIKSTCTYSQLSWMSGKEIEGFFHTENKVVQSLNLSRKKFLYYCTFLRQLFFLQICSFDLHLENCYSYKWVLEFFWKVWIACFVIFINTTRWDPVILLPAS